MKSPSLQEIATGGNALKFYASVRLDIRRIGAIKKGDEIIGNETKLVSEADALPHTSHGDAGI